MAVYHKPTSRPRHVRVVQGWLALHGGSYGSSGRTGSGSQMDCDHVMTKHPQRYSVGPRIIEDLTLVLNNRVARAGKPGIYRVYRTEAGSTIVEIFKHD